MIEYRYFRLEVREVNAKVHEMTGDDWRIHTFIPSGSIVAILFERETHLEVVKQCGICSKDGHTTDEHVSHPLAGAWVVYDRDGGPYAFALFETIEEAAKAVAIQGWGKVGFWIFGMELREAIEAWEERP